MNAPSPDTFLRVQTILTVALMFVLGVAGWGVKRFVDLVDRLETSVDGLYSRVTALEVQMGIIPNRRKTREPA